MKAKRNWQSLDISQQLIVAEAAAKNHARKLSYLKNVIAIGFGRRERQDKLGSEICIKVSVVKKLKPDQIKVGKIPDYCFTTQKDNHGLRHSYAVPTDVSVMEEIELQGAVGGNPTVSRRGGKGENGTACCYVKFQGYDDYYMLGCAHTFALIKRLNKPTVQSRKNNITYTQTSAERQMGNLKYIGSLRYTDAAVVLINDFQNVASGYGPNNNTFNGTWNGRYPDNYTLYTRRGELSCRLVQYIQYISLDFHKEGQKKTYRFPNIAVSETVNGRAIGGDSGSPYVSENGYLLGMHFAGGGKYAYSMPIHQVFQSFNPALVLAR